MVIAHRISFYSLASFVLLLSIYVCMCMSVYMHYVQGCQSHFTNHRARDTGSCHLSGVGAGNGTWVFIKSDACPSLLSPLSYTVSFCLSSNCGDWLTIQCELLIQTNLGLLCYYLFYGFVLPFTLVFRLHQCFKITFNSCGALALHLCISLLVVSGSKIHTCQ